MCVLLAIVMKTNKKVCNKRGVQWNVEMNV